MIWLALAVASIAAAVAYRARCQRDARIVECVLDAKVEMSGYLARRAESLAQAAEDRINEVAPRTPPLRSDNIKDPAKILQFGKRPKPDTQPDGVA